MEIYISFKLENNSLKIFILASNFSRKLKFNFNEIIWNFFEKF